MGALPDKNIVLRKEIIEGIAAQFKKDTGKATFTGFGRHLKEFAKTHSYGVKYLDQLKQAEKDFPDNVTINRALNRVKESKGWGANPELRDLLCYYAFSMSWEDKMKDLLGEENYSYEDEKAESDRLRKTKKDKIGAAAPQQSNTTKKDEANTKQLGFRRWLAANITALIIPVAILTIVTAILMMKVKENPVKDDFSKKQVEAVLALYKKLKSTSWEFKLVLKNRYSWSVSWQKDSVDNFYESQIKNLSILQMKEVFFSDKPGLLIKYLMGKNMLVDMTSPDQIVDSFGHNMYFIDVDVPIDTTLPSEFLISDLAFSLNDVMDGELIEYSRSLLLPDSVKLWLRQLASPEDDVQTLNKIMAESTNEVIVIGPKGTIEDDFTGVTPLNVWYDALKPSDRVTFIQLFTVIDNLERSIIDFLKSQEIPID